MFTSLKTPRLHLRQMTVDDGQEILFLRSDKNILRYLDIPVAESIEDALAFVRKINSGIENDDCHYWGMATANDNRLIGTICLWKFSEDRLSGDVGYLLHPDFQGKGLMQETLKVVLDFGFHSLKMEKINAEVDPENIRSIKLLEKFGFVESSRNEETVIFALARRR